jgi:N-methylhydantoinase B
MGAGAHPDEDGANAYSSGMHNNANIPIEMIESETPLTIVRYSLRGDSGGAGRQRGGLGLCREWRIDAEEAIFTANLERFRSRPYGLAGGRPAAPGRLTLIRDGAETALRSKVGNLRLKRGDVIRLETSGGGGFGDPRERDPGAAARDRALGYVTDESV